MALWGNLYILSGDWGWVGQINNIDHLSPTKTVNTLHFSLICLIAMSITCCQCMKSMSKTVNMCGKC